MVTADRLPMRDVLVDQLNWSEDDARAFLDVLFAPTENLATKDDVAAVRADLTAVREELTAVREELRGEINGVREELRGEIHGVREELRGEINGVREELREEIKAASDDLRRYVDQRLAELEKREQERESRIFAEFKAQVRAVELRMALLFIGGFGALVGLIIERT